MIDEPIDGIQGTSYDIKEKTDGIQETINGEKEYIETKDKANFI